MSHDLNQKTVFEKSVLIVSILFISIFLAGTNACQEDYDLGSQSNVATETPETDDTNTANNTRTPTPAPTNTPENTATPEPTETPEGADENSTNNAATDLLTELSLLKDDKDETVEKDAASVSTKSASSSEKTGNWLGKGFEKGEDDGIGIDSDNDGFADWFEDESGSDNSNASSVPALTTLKITLSSRLKGLDDDHDGLNNKDEAKNKTSTNVSDTDNDGFLDGIEVNSGTDPLNSRSRPGDSDKDGVGDELEGELNMNGATPDSDSDGLKDDLELALGSNPLDPDTDKDGILDGKEYNLGFDPVQKE